MSYQVSCPCCNNVGLAPENFLHRPIRCKRCNTRFLVLTKPAPRAAVRKGPHWPVFLEDMPPVLVDCPLHVRS